MKIFTIILIALPLFIFGQSQKKIDSLLNIYTTTNVDSIRLKASNRITSYYLYRDISKAKSYGKTQLKFAKQLGNIEGEIKANSHLSTIYTSLSKYDSAQHYIERAIYLSKLSKNLGQQSIATHSLVNLEISRGNYEEAENLNEGNLIFNQKRKDTFGIALSHDSAYTIYVNRGQTLSALKSVLKSLELFEELNKEIRIADAMHKLGILENTLENFDSSIEYSKKALKVYKKFEDVEYQASVLNILGISYKFKKDWASAKKYFNQSIELSEQHGYKSIILVSLPHLIDVYFETKDNKNAKKLIDKGLITATSINSEEMASYLNMRLARYYKNVGQFDDALKLLALVSNNTSIQSQNKVAVYKIKSEIFRLQNNYKDALFNFENFKKLQDSSFERKNISKINDLRIIHQTEQKEAEIALQQEEIKTLNEKGRADKLEKGLYAGGMTSALALAGLFLFGFNQRIKKNKIAREKQDEIYKQEIAHKKKELTSQTLHLVQKNTFIQELMENFESIKNSPEKFKMEFRRIVMLLKKENASDKDWGVFKTYFAEVHNDFDQKLKTLYADISEKEIRLAAFLRMNLTTKEIAATLNVLPDSILKSKYRLKKKLNLDKEMDLTSFLNTL